jgi:hypothetical protein
MNKKVDISNTVFEVCDDHIIYDNKILKTPAGNKVISGNPRLLDQIVSELDSFDSLSISDFSSWSLYSLQKDFFENPREDMTMAVDDVILMDPTLRSCAGPEALIQFQKWNVLVDYLKEHDVNHPGYVQSMSIEDTKEWIDCLGDEYIKNHNKLIVLIKNEIDNLYPSQKACLLGLLNYSNSFIYSLLIVIEKCSPSEFANAIFAGQAINPKHNINEGDLDGNRDYINHLILAATTVQNYIKYSNIDENHEVNNLIIDGESKNVEFKSSLRKSIGNPDVPDKVIEEAILKSISGFVNSDGGHLFIGVNDDKEIIGLENDGFKTDDDFLLHLKNIIKERIIPDIFPYINGGEIISKNGEKFCHVDCRKQESFKAFWVKLKKEEKFFVRRGPSTDQLSPREASKYIIEKNQ